VTEETARRDELYTPIPLKQFSFLSN
jgi:hypothetical protein